MTYRVGLLGCGTVGAAVARQLTTRAYDPPLALARVAVRDVTKPRPVRLPPGLLTANAYCTATDFGVDLVVEAIGGDGAAAYDLVRSALEAGKPVVTANTRLLATYGPDLDKVAAANGVCLRYEAGVAGAVPVVRVLREALAGDRVTRVEAVLDGRDAAATAVLLARVAFGHRLTTADVIGPGAAASDARLVATITPDAVVVVPLPRGHPLAAVRGVDNAVVVEAECAGRLVLTGRGAGGAAAASAVLGDLLAAARGLADDGR